MKVQPNITGDLLKLLEKSVQSMSGRTETMNYEPICDGPQALANWTCSILIVAEYIELLFSIHFELSKFLSLARSIHGLKPGAPCSRDKIFSANKELCNMIAGNISNALGLNNKPAGISLPMIMPGFDYAIINHSDQGFKFDIDCQYSESSFKSTFFIRSLDWPAFNQIDFLKKNVTSGKIELL